MQKGSPSKGKFIFQTQAIDNRIKFIAPLSNTELDSVKKRQHYIELGKSKFINSSPSRMQLKKIFKSNIYSLPYITQLFSSKSVRLLTKNVL